MGTANNVQVAGPITVYTAAESEAEPADTVDYGTAWGNGWTDAGFTEGGANVEIGGEDVEIRVDQHNAPINSIPVTEEMKVTVRMSEATLTNIQLACGVGSVSTATNEDTLKFGSTARYAFKAIGIEGWGTGTTASVNKYRRVILHRARPSRSITLDETKDGVRMVEVTFEALVDTTETAGRQIGIIIDEN